MSDNSEETGKKAELELFQAFLEEADEMIQQIEVHSAGLEENPSDLSHIHGIFRAVHSLKGNSSFFNFVNVQGFCHTLENYLDLVREQKVEINRDTVTFILEGADHLKSIFSRIKYPDISDAILTEAQTGYRDRVKERVDRLNDETGLETLRKELLQFFKTNEDKMRSGEDCPINELRDLIVKSAPRLVEDKRKSRSAPGHKYMYADLEVTREYMDLKALVQDAVEGKPDENSFSIFMKATESLIKKHESAGDKPAVAQLESMKEDFEMFYQDEIGMDEVLAQAVSAALEQYAEGVRTAETPPSPPAPPAPAPRPGDAGAVEGAGNDNGRKTGFAKVDESLLDVFIDNVGELITLGELFNYIQQKLAGGELKGLAANFKHTNQSFAELSQKLQKSLYEIRKTPVERALAKLPRLVRNIARESGKKVRVSTSGGENEVDKSQLDKIETILTHLARNSADHGIEPPDERLALGKDEQGTINVKVTTDKLKLFIEVNDDGRGVDVERVRQVAVEQGLVTENNAAKLPEREIVNYILRPGFSTAGQVTETSGRGVGMDVLATSVMEMGGEMTMENFPGKGLTIKISIPLAYTTRIRLGLSLAVGDCVFLIPADNVRESFRACAEDISCVEGKGEVVMRWGRVYPAVRLSKLFRIKPKHEKIQDSICLLAEAKGQVVCLVVDEMMGQRQIVYKQLIVQTREPNAFEGISILDGVRMALILSVDGIIRQFQSGAAGPAKKLRTGSCKQSA